MIEFRCEECGFRVAGPTREASDAKICTVCLRAKKDRQQMSSLTLRQLQEELRPWVAHNFGERPSWQPLLGIQEECGELSHAHLKQAQGIRTNEDHAANKKDAVADLIIFLADYCNAEGIDLQKALEDTWAKVRQRDWKARPEKPDE